MPTIELVGNTLTATGEFSSAKYEVTAGALTVTLQNLDSEPIKYLVVADSPVKVEPAKGELFRLMHGDSTAQVELSANRAGWEDHPLLATTIEAQSSTEMKWSVTDVGSADLSAPATPAATPAVSATPPASTEVATPTPATPSAVTLESPLDFQVFQRTDLKSGPFRLAGTLNEPCDSIEWTIEGKSEFGPLPQGAQKLTPKDNRFETTATLPSGGWYRMNIKGLRAGKTVFETEIPHVGIGEVFVGAGQSNSTSCGEFPTKQTSGMVANYTGKSWRLADDPQLGASDDKKGGSYYPAFGDALYATYKVPIGITVTGCTGTSVNYWQPNVNLYKKFVKRINSLGPNGFRAILWHQGETDKDMPKEDYFKRLKTVIDSSRKDAGWQVPWVVAQTSYAGAPDDVPVRLGQKETWLTGLALEGPDTDKLKGDHRDRTGVHFSPKGLKAHGELWATKVAPLIEGKH